MVLNISLAIKILKLGVYTYFSQKWAPIQETLMKWNICLFYIKVDKLLEKYNEIWEKVKNSMRKEFDTKPAYNGKYLRAQSKSFREKINPNFDDHKIWRKGSQFISLSVVLVGF